MILSSGLIRITVNSKFLKLSFKGQFFKIDNHFQINSIQERIKNIESSDIDGKLELLYLKKDIEAIKRYMDVHYLSNITFRNSRNKKE